MCILTLAHLASHVQGRKKDLATFTCTSQVISLPINPCRLIIAISFHRCRTDAVRYTHGINHGSRQRLLTECNTAPLNNPQPRDLLPFPLDLLLPANSCSGSPTFKCRTTSSQLFLSSAGLTTPLAAQQRNRQGSRPRQQCNPEDHITGLALPLPLPLKGIGAELSSWGVTAPQFENLCLVLQELLDSSNLGQMHLRSHYGIVLIYPEQFSISSLVWGN